MELLLRIYERQNNSKISMQGEKLHLYRKYFLQIILALKQTNLWYVIKMCLNLNLQILELAKIFVYLIPLWKFYCITC